MPYTAAGYTQILNHLSSSAAPLARHTGESTLDKSSTRGVDVETKNKRKLSEVEKKPPSGDLPTTKMKEQGRDRASKRLSM